MEEHDDSIDAIEKHYPRGRGYGNDYMRGGEVFGGYGYRERADYDRPRGELEDRRSSQRELTDRERTEPGGPAFAHPSSLESAEAEEDDVGDPPERFPQDARAGGWQIPHDFDGARRDELSFGDTSGGLSRSRSYYVTQAQLQQRLYEQGRLKADEDQAES